MGFGFVYEPLDEHAEEAAKVWMGHQQIECELHGIALDRGRAFGALAVVAESADLRSQLSDLPFRSQFLPKRGRPLGFRGSGHASDYEPVGLGGPSRHKAESHLLLLAHSRMTRMGEGGIWRSGD